MNAAPTAGLSHEQLLGLVEFLTGENAILRCQVAALECRQRACVEERQRRVWERNGMVGHVIAANLFPTETMEDWRRIWEELDTLDREVLLKVALPPGKDIHNLTPEEKQRHLVSVKNLRREYLQSLAARPPCVADG